MQRDSSENVKLQMKMQYTLSKSYKLETKMPRCHLNVRNDTLTSDSCENFRYQRLTDVKLTTAV